MKLRLPNRQEIDLDSSLPYSEKLIVVETLLDEWLSYWNSTFSDNPSTRTALDILGNYLGKEPKKKEVG